MNEKKELIHKSIQTLSSTEIEEIFRLLYINKTKYTRNNNGIFVNLHWLNDDIIEKLYIYIKFCLESYKEITDYEKMKNKINLEQNINLNNNEKKVILENTSKINIGYKSNKGSTSMKYYLLKKKFLKTAVCYNISESYDKIMKSEEFI